MPGVLQRLALCYLAAALLYRVLNRFMPATAISARASIALALAMVLAFAYWLALATIPVPGGHAGDLTPDGNLGAWIDRARSWW